jgi:hypothetical protein
LRNWQNGSGIEGQVIPLQCAYDGEKKREKWGAAGREERRKRSRMEDKGPGKEAKGL